MKFLNLFSVLIFVTCLVMGMKTPTIQDTPFSDTPVIGTIRLEATKQGLIMGGKDGNNSKIEINSFQWGSGKSIGSNSVNPNKPGRSESTVVITKEVDKASLNMLQAFTNKEGLKSVEIQLTKTSPGGKQQVFKIIRLSGAMIQNVMSSDSGKKPHSTPETYQQEEITFTFTHIEMFDENGKSDNSWNL